MTKAMFEEVRARIEAGYPAERLHAYSAAADLLEAGGWSPADAAGLLRALAERAASETNDDLIDSVLHALALAQDHGPEFAIDLGPLAARLGSLPESVLPQAISVLGFQFEPLYRPAIEPFAPHVSAEVREAVQEALAAIDHGRKTRQG